MEVYQLAQDYSFMYWQTPSEELTRMHSLSEKRATGYILAAEDGKELNYDRITNIIPAQFCAAMSLQISHALQIVLQHYNAVFEEMDGIFLQRLPEIESGPEILLVIGLSFGRRKFAVTPVKFSDRFHKETEGTFLGSFHEEPEKKEFLH